MPFALAFELAFARPGTSQPSPASAPARITLHIVETHDVSARRARSVVTTLVAPVDRCFRDARSRDPAAASGVARFTIVVRFARDGRANAVEISPSDLTPSLSSCLASAFDRWRQPGRIGMRAAVRMRLDVR